MGSWLLNRWTILVLAAALILRSGAVAAAATGGSFYVNYAATVKAEDLARYEISIVAPDSQVNPELAHTAGKHVFAYISVGELDKDSPLRAEALRDNISLLKNPVWKGDIMDVSRPEWTRFILERIAPAAARYDGFFLDTVDSVDTLSERFPTRAKEFRAGMANLIRDLKKRFPEKQIILNRGFTVFHEVRDVVNGFLVESLFQTYDFESGHYTATTPEETAGLRARLKTIAATGIPIYVLDYVDPANPDLARKTAARIQKLGYHAFISTPKLEGADLAGLANSKENTAGESSAQSPPPSLVTTGPVAQAHPEPSLPAHPLLGEQARHVLVLYGNAKLEKHPIVSPAQSFVCRLLQMPLEWFGFEVDYLDILHNKLPEKLPAGTRAIALDGFLKLPANLEDPVADWVIARHKEGIRCLILDHIPFHAEDVRERFLAALGVEGGGSSISGPHDIRLASVSPAMNFEVPLRLFSNDFIALTKPAGAESFVTIEAKDESEQTVLSEPVFTAPWGGVALAPYILFQRPDLLDLWVVDPFAFIAGAMSPPNWPIPDSTTRDGLRLFYSHIDADGFSDMSEVNLGHRSAEVIRDEVLKHYPLPITASVIESETSGKLKEQKPGDAEALEEVARSIFALPNVQVASHTYTHPFFWMKEAPELEELQADGIAGWNLGLADPGSYPKLDFKREINGSIDYIRSRLTGKPVDLLLWSGDCLPPPEALATCAEAGVANLNGGDTTLSTRNPSLTCVAPRTLAWEGQLQVYAANQNEEVYTNDWKGPIFGTFSQVTETFERTGTPRRLKPVNVYFHFFSGDRYDSLKGVRTAYDWAMQHPLHAVTALTYARIAADARDTRIVSEGPNTWRLINHGDCRTFRMASTRLVPDIAACEGVTGYNVANGSLYIHTSGLAQTRLVLAESPKPALYLVSSTAEIRFQQFASRRLAFEIHDLRPANVVIGGGPPQATAMLSIGGTAHSQRFDEQGQIRLSLPGNTAVTIDLSHANHAQR